VAFSDALLNKTQAAHSLVVEGALGRYIDIPIMPPVGANGEVPIRFFLVDGQEVVRAGTPVFVGAAGDLEVVGEAATIAETLDRLPAARVQIAAWLARPIRAASVISAR
jgi:hypothetical protein